MTVSIIIVNYNTVDLIVNCIKSIYLHTNNLQFEIIIVDNASEDGSQQLLKTQYPNIKLIESDVNLGFGLANNLGAEQAKGDFLFFLNSDTILFENSVKILSDFFIKNELKLKLGVIGALLVDSEFKVNGFGSNFPSVNNENHKNISKLPFFKRSPQQLELFDADKMFFKIDYVIGADMFMRRSLFNELEGFSKDFFMYYEESDLQKRITNFGYNCFIITTTKIIHLEEGSGKSIKFYSNRKRTIVHISLVTYLKRNEKQKYFSFVLLDFFILLLTFFNFKYSFKENLSYFQQILKAY